jgi:hypothetical protein
MVRTVTLRRSEEPVRLWLMLPPTPQKTKTLTLENLESSEVEIQHFLFYKLATCRTCFFYTEVFSRFMITITVTLPC